MEALVFAGGCRELESPYGRSILSRSLVSTFCGFSDVDCGGVPTRAATRSAPGPTMPGNCRPSTADVEHATVVLSGKWLPYCEALTTRPCSSTRKLSASLPQRRASRLRPSRIHNSMGSRIRPNATGLADKSIVWSLSSPITGGSWASPGNTRTRNANVARGKFWRSKVIERVALNRHAAISACARFEPINLVLVTRPRPEVRTWIQVSPPLFGTIPAKDSKHIR